jgi:hypothetical protein
MRNKHLLAVTLLLPFVTMPSIASAGHAYGHWQKASRLADQRVPYAQAYYYGPAVADQYAPWEPMPLCTYQGGPKTNTWACR